MARNCTQELNEIITTSNSYSFSDDPYLVSAMADALVRGIESTEFSGGTYNYTKSNHTQVATIVKHYVGYSQPDSTNDRYDATVCFGHNI